MAKTKEVVEEEEEEEVKSDGLEIASIGSLYEGPWEKKYWSSSRGKDRYPYPVGYHAVRAHNGSTCKMEIHEGPKGPLFMITSADGHSCSGQTPDIAWDKFQKKYCPRMRTWHGKRLSCKIDGMEFFGFRNSFVQRLLRELVANINGTAERNLLSSSLCSGASGGEHDKHPDTCTYPHLQPDLAKAQIAKKRSRCETKNTKLLGTNGIKKPRSQGLTCNSKASNSVQFNQTNHKHESLKTVVVPKQDELEASNTRRPLSASKEGNDFHKVQGSASVHIKFKAAEGKDGFPLESPDHLAEESVAAQEVSKLVGYKNGKSTRVANNLAEDNLSKRDKDEDASIPDDSPGAKDFNLCAPDTLDFVQDNRTHCSAAANDKSTLNFKEDFTTANNVISEELVTDSHAEEEIGASISNATSVKSDFDSAGLDIATAMMTVLLPQAIPLLNKVSKKKKATTKSSESLSYMVNLREKNDKIGHFVDASFVGTMPNEKINGEMKERMLIPNVEHGSVQSFEHSKSVVLDSFEDDVCGDHITNQVISSSNILESDQPSIDKINNLSTTQKELVVVDLRNESSVCHVESSKSGDILCHDDANLVLDKKLLEDDVCKSESVLDCRFSSKKVPSELDRDVCMNLDKNSAGIGIHSVGRDLKIKPDCAQDANDSNQRGISCSVQLSRKDVSNKTVATETGSVAQTPAKVYSRKKVPKISPLRKKFDGPLSESIICRKSAGDSVSETYHTTETLPASEVSRMRSSDDKPCKVLFDAKTRLEGQSHVSPVISQNATALCDSGGKEFSSSSDPYVIHIKKFEAQSDKELVEQLNVVESNPSVVYEKQETSLHECDTSNSKQVKVSSDLKLQKNVELNNELEGIVEYMGCYFHPMPISSVLITTKGDEIYICVSCGLLDDRNQTLFIYKVAIQEPCVGCPSLVGHTSIMLPFLRDIFGRDIALERSYLLFTPDGQHLILLGSIKTPYCREGRIDCLCSTCTSECFEKNVIKIMQVKHGYVSVVAKLKADESVHCISVCEPNHVIAVEESGSLHLWEMNSTWSAQIEEFTIPVHDYIYPCIVELKRIPNCATLVVGHNGFGEFGVWDISKRVFISRFTAPSSSIYQFSPINMFCWQRNGSVFTGTNVDEYINGIMAAAKLQPSKYCGNNSFLPSEGETIAIWLLVSTVTVSDAQHNHISSDCQRNPVRLWRLALLVKNMVILGSPLDPRAAAVGALFDHGIIGTDDGRVYMWELSSGIKVGTLHHFKGGTVSCIATDDTSSQVLAVAGDGGQLLLYLHASKRQHKSMKG